MIKVVLLKKMKMVEMILMGVMAFLVAVRWFLMLTIKQNITKIINFPVFPAPKIFDFHTSGTSTGSKKIYSNKNSTFL